MAQSKFRIQPEWNAVVTIKRVVHKQIPTNPNQLKQHCKNWWAKILCKLLNPLGLLSFSQYCRTFYRLLYQGRKNNLTKTSSLHIHKKFFDFLLHHKIQSCLIFVLYTANLQLIRSCREMLCLGFSLLWAPPTRSLQQHNKHIQWWKCLSIIDQDGPSQQLRPVCVGCICIVWNI